MTNNLEFQQMPPFFPTNDKTLIDDGKTIRVFIKYTEDAIRNAFTEHSTRIQPQFSRNILIESIPKESRHLFFCHIGTSLTFICNQPIINENDWRNAFEGFANELTVKHQNRVDYESDRKFYCEETNNEILSYALTTNSLTDDLYVTQRLKKDSYLSDFQLLTSNKKLVPAKSPFISHLKLLYALQEISILQNEANMLRNVRFGLFDKTLEDDTVARLIVGEGLFGLFDIYCSISSPEHIRSQKLKAFLID